MNSIRCSIGVREASCCQEALLCSSDGDPMEGVACMRYVKFAGLQNPFFEGIGDCLRLAMQIEFYKDVLYVVPGRKMTDVQSLGQTFCRQSLCKQRQHLDFSA